MMIKVREQGIEREEHGYVVWVSLVLLVTRLGWRIFETRISPHKSHKLKTCRCVMA